jgi:hypothetical protein
MGRPKKSVPQHVEPEFESQEIPEADEPTATISKADAIRRTLAEGITSSLEGVRHIKERYGLDVTTEHFSASKSKEKDAIPAPVAAAAQAPAAPKRGRPPGSTNKPAPAVENPAPTPEATVTKADAVRQALANGKEGPEEGTDYIRDEFGIEMTRQMFSSYKAQEKARDAKQGASAPKGRPGRKPASVAQLDQVVKTIQPTMGSGVVGDLAAIKHLVERLGVEEVKQIADLFG